MKEYKITLYGIRQGSMCKMELATTNKTEALIVAESFEQEDELHTYKVAIVEEVQVI